MNSVNVNSGIGGRLEREDYARDRLRGYIARDKARLNEDIRCGRRAAASAKARDLARDLARDQRALNARRDSR
jgi:hypothetical protein